MKEAAGKLTEGGVPLTASTKPRSVLRLVALATVLGLAAYGFPSAAAKPAPRMALAAQSKAVSITPTLRKDFKPHAKISAAESQKMVDGVTAIRERLAAQVQSPPVPAEGAIPLPPAAPSSPAVESAFHGAPGTFIIGRNNRNTNAQCVGNCSPLAEPAAANEGNRVFYSGNFRHSEFSTNGGVTYTNVGYPAGPAEAPTVCCDTDVIYDHSRGVTFYSALYLNAGQTNGILRIFVRRAINLPTNCFYDIDPGGTANNVFPDYPHLGLSNNFLYFNGNNIRNGTTWIGAMLERLNVDQMADCVTATGAVITFTGPVGQRILVPGHGARDVMYAAWVEDSNTWRIFSWADNSGTVFQTLRDVSPMTFGDPLCLGGTNNADWGHSFITAGIVGFSVRVAIGGDMVSMFAGTIADASHPEAHIHGARFRVGTSQTALTLVQQPVIFNNTNCIGVPMVGANDRGDLGLSIAFGSTKAGGGSAVQGVVFMIDEFSPGPGGFTLNIVASGTHNPTNTRYGDYFTVRRNAPCGEFFDATSYALLNGTAAANVNARYVEFGRNRDRQCHLAWMNAIPAT
jgi:hypothetical protein